MSNIKAIIKSSFAALFLTQACLLAGCDEGTDVDIAAEDEIDDLDDVEEEGFRAWTGYTSEEYPPLICQNRFAVRGVDCSGSYCDDISLDCRNSGRAAGQHDWLPYFSEEGSGSADQGVCEGNRQWLTGIACSGGYCDNLSIRCSVLQGSSTGNCQWSDWYSEEDGPFVAPSGRFLKGIECEGSYCDNKRYRHCRMN